MNNAAQVNNIQPLKKTKEEWSRFVSADVLNFLVSNELQKITVDDGMGNKATIRINANGEYKVQTTSIETM